MRWPIRSQLLVPLLLLLAGTAGITTWTALASARRARQQVETRVRNVAEYLAGEKSFRLTESILLQVKRLSGADYVLVPPAGKAVGTLGTTPVDLPPADTLGEDWQDLRLGPPIRAGGETYLCSGIRLTRGPNEDDALYILYPESLWRDALWEAVWPSLVLGGSLGLASVGLALGVGQRLGRRLRALERRTRLIAAGDFSPMPLPRRNDEIRDLTESVNEMAQRLARLQKTVQQTERLRLLGQVSGGLAHQVRNGLTGARLAVQLYTRECAGQTDTAALEVALRQLTLLETNLKRFLDLGRDGPLRREPCPVPALVGEAVELLRPQCRHVGIDLRWQAPAWPGVVTGDAGQLGQLFLNVLGNAVEAAGPGGTVEVRLARAEGPLLVVEVLDSGPGPPPEVAERLFEPFVTGKPEGVGLGLAVARQVAESHGGQIAWGRQGGRTCFRIELVEAADAPPCGPPAECSPLAPRGGGPPAGRAGSTITPEVCHPEQQGPD
jgi:signal transduction histidine kinase